MQKFMISIEERVIKVFDIEAQTMEDAMDVADKMYWAGELVLDGDSEVHARMMHGYNPETDETTEWIEF